LSGNKKAIETLDLVETWRWTKTVRELLSSNRKVISAHVDLLKWTFFGRLHLGP